MGGRRRASKGVGSRPMSKENKGLWPVDDWSLQGFWSGLKKAWEANRVRAATQCQKELVFLLTAAIRVGVRRRGELAPDGTWHQEQLGRDLPQGLRPRQQLPNEVALPLRVLREHGDSHVLLGSTG